MKNKKVLLIIRVNIALFFIGLSVIIGLRKTDFNLSAPHDLYAVQFNLDLSENGFIVKNTNTGEIMQVNPIFDTDTTTIKLPIGEYKIIYGYYADSIEEHTFVISSDQNVNIATSEPLPTSLPVGSDGKFVDPGVYCTNYKFVRGFSAYHNGLDISKENGCWIAAVADGEVIFKGWKAAGEGYAVIIQHDNGLLSRYYHGSGEFKVEIGDQVKAGQKIMYMGSTGNSVGIHLHLEIMKNGVKVDPESYITIKR